jgi:hypothetical protein
MPAGEVVIDVVTLPQDFSGATFLPPTVPDTNKSLPPILC